jgi:pimeloyl-ACP methyl ester carboxylesterase
MARFVFVHGAWQGAWCWDGIAALLSARGHETAAFDLPGHGEDRTPPASVTLQDYVNRTAGEALSSPEDPILVGNSMGGGIISQVAESLAGRIRASVYLAGLVPPDGTEMLRFVAEYDPAFPAEFVWSSDRRTAGITQEGARRFLYNCCPESGVTRALSRLTPEPVAPFECPLALTDKRYGQVPRFYIECLRDRAVPLSLQRAMHAAAAFERVYSIDTDHSPFFSAPEDLVETLHSIAREA